MESAEIARRFPRLLRTARPHRGAVGQPDRRRPDAAAGQRRHGAVQAVLPRPAGAAVPRGPPASQKCVRTAGHRGGRQDHPARHVLPDAGQLLVRRLLQGAGDPVRLGAADRLGGRRRLRLRPRTGCGSPSTTTTTRPRTSGTATVGVPLDRIQRRGMADNFWSMGVPGPCGPCSEIYYDRGPEYGREGGPVADEDRYLEVWNLVFMQFERGAGAGKEDFPILGELPSKNIDTGMGLERMAALLQGVDNIYEIDTMWRVLDRAAELTEQKYGREHRDRRRAAGRRRPRAHRGDAGRRRGAARPTRAAATCCAGSSAAASATCGCWPGRSAAGPAARRTAAGTASTTCTSWPARPSTASATSTPSCAGTRRTSTP